jgi:DNA-directed RNA polymerase subunit RPC12/RpoP
LFRLLYDAARNVLLTELSGIYTEEDIVLRDRQVGRFVARHGLARGLMDYREVTRVDVPMEVIVRRAHAPPMLPGQTRVVVAPSEPAYSLNRIISAHQYFSRKVEPLMVPSPQDALRALGGSHFHFVPVEEDDHARWERTALAALAAIDARGRKRAEDYRRASADLRQALHGVRRRNLSSIMVSDLFNTMLRHTELSDGDLSIRCPACRRTTSLAHCPLRGRRQTTYSCLRCGATLVELVPESGTPGDASGYSLAGFDVRTQADISCDGIVLPRSARRRATGIT